MLTSANICIVQLLHGFVGGPVTPVQNLASSKVNPPGLEAMEIYVTCACDKKEMRRKTAVKTGM
jgi:hypothetical protein